MLLFFYPNAGFSLLGHFIGLFVIFLPMQVLGSFSVTGFGVSHAISQVRVKREAAVWSSQTFTGSDFGDTPARELALFR